MSDQPKPTTGTTAEHELKTWPQFFAKILDGSKPFEVRRNDRNFESGDSLVLREWNPETGEYTGRSIKRTVSYIYPADGYGDGVKNHGYCVMGLSNPTTTGDEQKVVNGPVWSAMMEEQQRNPTTTPSYAKASEDTGEWTKWEDSLLSLRLPDGSRIECSSTKARDKVIDAHNAAVKEAYQKGYDDGNNARSSR